jgi:hypothetical protein
MSRHYPNSPSSAASAPTDNAGTSQTAVSESSTGTKPEQHRASETFASSSDAPNLNHSAASSPLLQDDPELTPRLDPAAVRMAPTLPFMLPDPAWRQSRGSEDVADTASNRMSFSSLYSLGSAIVHGARGMAGSGPSSVTGSEQDRKQSFHVLFSGIALTDSQ